MSDMTKKRYDDVLDEQTTTLLGESLEVMDVSPQRLKKLKDNVMQRIDAQRVTPHQSFITIRPDEGSWIEIAPKIKKKILTQNAETGCETFLLQMEPGATHPPHSHELEEHCLVLEGQFSFGDDISLRAGDYHIAPKGSEHGTAFSERGVLLYIQTVQPSGLSAHC